jgi:hypothetical protein
MRTRNLLLALALGTGLAGTGLIAYAQHQHGSMPGMAGQMPSSDARIAVQFPEMMRTHTLTNMRDHLLALSEIQEALATGAYDTAAKTAEQRLGMSSLALHGAHELSAFMPQGMQEIGTAMHRSASRFALEAQNSAATGDVKPALAALAVTMKTCAACHSTYRLE